MADDEEVAKELVYTFVKNGLGDSGPCIINVVRLGFQTLRILLVHERIGNTHEVTMEHFSERQHAGLRKINSTKDFKILMDAFIVDIIAESVHRSFKRYYLHLDYSILSQFFTHGVFFVICLNALNLLGKKVETATELRSMLSIPLAYEDSSDFMEDLLAVGKRILSKNRVRDITINGCPLKERNILNDMIASDLLFEILKIQADKLRTQEETPSPK
jgi:hypothetical protein